MTFRLPVLIVSVLSLAMTSAAAGYFASSVIAARQPDRVIGVLEKCSKTVIAANVQKIEASGTACAGPPKYTATGKEIPGGWDTDTFEITVKTGRGATYSLESRCSVSVGSSWPPTPPSSPFASLSDRYC